MRKLFILIGFLHFVSLGLSPAAFAGKDKKNCTVCMDEVKDDQKQKSATCSKGHSIHQDCLAFQVKAIEDVTKLETHGLECCGENCKERIPLAQIRDLLAPAEKLVLEERLAKAKAPVEESKAKTETQRLTEGLEEAFNLCCPIDGCGHTLDQIEGCNAAKCSNEECQTTFCYLCLKPQIGKNGQTDSQAAHAHVREHSGNYWEQRPGYADRYKWLLARKNLDQLFKRKVDPSVRDASLNSRKDMLEENKMWPMPAGLMSSKWVEEVKASPLSQEKKIELLQNEFIYRRQADDKKNADLVEAEIKRLGGKVLASLDIRDAQGLYPQAPVAQNHAANVAPAHAAAAPQAGAAAQIIPVDHNDPRVTRQFAALGNMYQIGNLILSGKAPRNMNQRAAEQFCRDNGGQLPTREQWEAIGRAMGRGTEAGYNRNVIPDMAGNWFWSSSVLPVIDDFAFYFNGYYGYVYHDSRRYDGGAVRCGSPVAAW